MRLFKTTAKALALCLAIGAALCAQDYKVALSGNDPNKGSTDLGDMVLTVMDKCNDVVSGDPWFSLMERDQESINAIMKEHNFQEDKLNSDQKRDLERLGVDFLLKYNVREYNRGYQVAFKILDIKTGQVMGSKSGNVPAPMPEAMGDKAEALLKELVQQVKARLGNIKPQKGEAHPFLADFDEIKEIIEDVVSIRKWNQIKDSSPVEVDFSKVTITSAFEDSHPVYKVKGRITFRLTANRNSVSTNFALPEFTQTGKDSVRNRIEKEVRKNAVQILSDLLGQLEE